MSSGSRLSLVLLYAGSGLALGVLAAAPLVTGLKRVHPSLLGWATLPTAFLLACVLARPAGARTRARAGSGLLAVIIAGLSALAARSATYPVALTLVAVACGVAAGFVPWPLGRDTPFGRVAPFGLPWARAPLPERRPAWVTGVSGAGLLIGAAEAFLPAGVVALLAAGACAMAVGLKPVPLVPSTRAGRGVLSTASWCLLVLGVTVWVEATNPAATWLGPVTSHGPDGRLQVALTFDDGPNDAMTAGVLDVLHERGVPATFFLVGKAVEREPEVAARVVREGHLVADHSFSHDAWSYLVPTYPELERGERSIRAATGVCPRFYRPPHGTHTPFVWFAAHRRNMHVVNWDVSAEDWSETDPDRLARRIVERAHPGAIILLHDGIDGRPGADRSVVVAALPAIIDGLRARGLEPVRLDTLLGEPAYRDDCSA